MRASQMFIPTLREVPSEAEAVSHRLMLRAGLMRKIASGIYCYLPLGLRTLRKIENIVREEMDRAGAQELVMPALLPSEYYRASGRWEVFGPEIFRLKDSGGRDFCLGPTHEEIFTAVVRNETRSYKALPINLYQIQTKYRDEIRPRFGAIRSREFVMKDAYSFDRDEAGLEVSYKAMREAYIRFLDRCCLKASVVDADTGAMGGSGSQEFVVESGIGESSIVKCDVCGYAANIEMAECARRTEAAAGETGSARELPLEKIATPDARTIDELVKFLGCSPADFAKTLIYRADGDRLIAAMVRGDRELNEAKLKNLIGCSLLEMADPDTVTAVTGAEVGFAGPVGIKAEVVVDTELTAMSKLIVGANETGYHLRNANPGRDFSALVTGDIRLIEEGEPCPRCSKPIRLVKAIEVGHIFKLGTKYSKALNCVYLDEAGREHLMVMGSYGIGISRVMASIIEQQHDEDGIIWPLSVAPFHAIIIPANNTDSLQMDTALKLYGQLEAEGFEILLDDRDERAGVKFKDADLTGIPIRITAGRKCGEGIVEYRKRGIPGIRELTIQEAVTEAAAEIRAGLKR